MSSALCRWLGTPHCSCPAGTGKPFVATSASAMAGDSGVDSFTEEKPGTGPRAEASETTVLKVSVGVQLSWDC